MTLTNVHLHYNGVIMSAMVPQITSLTIVYSTAQSGADQRKIKAPRHWPLFGEFTGHRWIHHTKPVTRKMFPFDDVIMCSPPKLCTVYGTIPRTKDIQSHVLIRKTAVFIKCDIVNIWMIQEVLRKLNRIIRFVPPTWCIAPKTFTRVAFAGIGMWKFIVNNTGSYMCDSPWCWFVITDNR